MDTSAVIKYFSYAFTVEATDFIDKVIDEKCVISFISETELQAWNSLVADDITVYKRFISKSIGYSNNRSNYSKNNRDKKEQ